MLPDYSYKVREAGWLQRAKSCLLCTSDWEVKSLMVSQILSFWPNDCNKVELLDAKWDFYHSSIALPALFAFNLGPVPGQECSGLWWLSSHCPRLNDVGQPDPQQRPLSILTYVLCVAELAMLLFKHTDSQGLVIHNCKLKKLNSW